MRHENEDNSRNVDVNRALEEGTADISVTLRFLDYLIDSRKGAPVDSNLRLVISYRDELKASISDLSD